MTWYRRATVASRILTLYMAFLLPALAFLPFVPGALAFPAAAG